MRTEFTKRRVEQPSDGGFFAVSGNAAPVAAALAANTALMAMRLAVASARRAYINRLRAHIFCSTVGASGSTPGILAFQKFDGAAATGGTQRTPAVLSPEDTTTDMTDVRDSNAALTVTGMTFRDVVAQAPVPLFVASGALWMDWVFEPYHPIILKPGEGLALRTLVIMPATQTWGFSYCVEYDEE